MVDQLILHSSSRNAALSMEHESFEKSYFSPGEWLLEYLSSLSPW